MLTVWGWEHLNPSLGLVDIKKIGDIPHAIAERPLFFFPLQSTTIQTELSVNLMKQAPAPALPISG